MDEETIAEHFAAVGPVSVRRMFGGQGIYSDGAIIAVVVGGTLMLKADERSAGAFQAAGCRQWTYPKDDGTAARMPYYALPDEAYDDPDAMADWARLAREAGHRAAASKAARGSAPKRARRLVKPEG